MAACGFQGYPGYSPRNANLSDDGRDSQAGYLELEIRPLDALTIGAALRAETYSDAGSKTTGKLTAHLQIADGIALRAAVSTGFRAPSLSQRRFNSILFVGSETGLTTVFAANEGHAIPRAFGVDSLEHETAENFSGGIVWSVADNFDIAVDVYRTEIENRVVRSSGIGCAGIAACDVERAATAAFFFNGVDTETEGVDLTVRGGLPFAGGYLWLSGNGNLTRTEIARGRLPAGAPEGLSFGHPGARPAAPQGQPHRRLGAGGVRCAVACEPLWSYYPASARHGRTEDTSRQYRGFRGADAFWRNAVGGGGQQHLQQAAHPLAEDASLECTLGHKLSDGYAVRA